MRPLLFLVAAMTMTTPLVASAHTQEDEAACTPDVMRLCMQVAPDEARIVACLGEKKRLLSPACFKVIDRGRGRAASIQKTKF